MSESILSPELLAAIAKIEGDIRRLQPRHAKGTKWTVYEILASTPEQGCDLPTAMTTAMFGDGYQLSHERRLLAITLARALTTVAALTAENAQLRETLTLGLGEQESVIAGLRAENERLISEITTACDTAMRLDIPTRELVGRLRAALPSSRETTDGQ